MSSQYLSVEETETRRESRTETTESLAFSSTAHVSITRVVEITHTIHDNICHLEEYDDAFFQQMDLPSYLEYVDDKRIFHMPRRGSDWDRVLRAAQFFGIQLWSFAEKIGPSSAEIRTASITALASCRVLLDIGHGQAAALAPTFDALYELGALLSRVSQIHDLFQAPGLDKELVADLYTEVIELVGQIAVHYRKRISSLGDAESLTVNFDVAFGNKMSSIWETKESVTARMWRLKLGNNGKYARLDAVRRWLKPERSTKAQFYDRVGGSAKRAEDTCEWLKPMLVEFLRSKDKIFTITGNEGSGKTVLAGWIHDRLQRPLNHTQYSTISFKFESEFTEKSTQLAFLKNVLFQLLERNIGDVELFEKLSEAYTIHKQRGKSHEFENSLWSALVAGMRSHDKRHSDLVFVIDGIEEIERQNPVDFLHAFRDHINKFHVVKLITLSKGVSHLSDGCKHLSLTPQLLYNDIRSYFRQSLASSLAATDRAVQCQVVDELAQKAKASFIWAYIACRFLLRQPSSPEKFPELARSIPSTVDGAMEKLLATIPQMDETTKLLLSSLLVAQRPLRVEELNQLLSINVQKRGLGAVVDVTAHIKEACSDIVIVSRGFVLFQSRSVRTYMHRLLGKSLPSAKESHQKIALALLLYIKLSLPLGFNPSFEPLTLSTVEEVLHSHVLLNYAVNNWLTHVSFSSFVTNKGGPNITAEFREVFPSTCQLPLLERACWHATVPNQDLIHHHMLSLKIRDVCLGEKHVSVFQTLIILGNIKASQSATDDAAELFYRAVRIGRETLSRFNSVLVTCTSYFLQLTESIKITSRTQIATHREEMILFMIAICKAKHGATDDTVIKWYKILSQLYINIKEDHRVTATYKELWEIYINRFGKSSTQARSIGEHLGELSISFSGTKETPQITEYETLILESTEELDIANEKRMSVLLHLAKSYQSQKKWLLAEKIYINLWRRFSQLTGGKASVEMHVTKMSIALEYSKFLQMMNRKEEASNILICVWAEYEHSKSIETESFMIQLREVGIMLKSFGLLHVAISVFSKIWGWFKSTSKATSQRAVETSVLIIEMAEEITRTTVTTKTTTTTTTEITEKVVREIFETHYERCKNSKVDAIFFTSSIALVDLYTGAGNWAQAEIVVRQTLELTWKAVLTNEATIKLTEQFASESILVAQRLATCYCRQRAYDKAEGIFLRIFNACLTSLRIDDARIMQQCEALVAFYEEYHRHDKIINVYIMLLDKTRAQLGATNKLTIRVLYALAKQSRMLGQPDTRAYYLEIVTTLNRGKKVCHPDAFDAAVILMDQFYEEKSWAELQHLSAVLWETFTRETKSCKFTEERVQLIYKRYTYVLEHYAKVQVAVLYKTSVEYRDTVRTSFGVSSSIYVDAMLALAAVCEREERHHHECVTIYEEVLKSFVSTKKTSVTVTETTVTTIKRRLTKIYVEVITSSSSTSTSTINLERAITLCVESYVQLKAELGCWHEDTLMKLQDAVVLYQKQNTQESNTKVLSLLQSSFTDNLIATSNSVTVYQAAIRLAAIYSEVSLAAQAAKLVQQVRHLMIFGNSFDSEFKFTVDKTLNRRAFVFLVAFEQRLSSKTVMNYSQIMAGILYEITLYEQYMQAAESNARTEIILEYGAKLRTYWVETRQEHHVVVLDRKLYQLFKNKYGSFIRAHEDHAKLFYYALLIDLGRDRSKVDFPLISCRAGNDKVASLLEAGDFKCAIEVARSTFGFASKQGFYNSLNHIPFAFQLAAYMAGIDVRKPSDTKLQNSAEALSREITTEALAILHATHIELVRLRRFEDVEGIVRLLGTQGLFQELEDLLTALWQSREVQKTWDSTRVLTIGRLLVHAHAANQNVATAIELCDRICYNLRRSRGPLDEVTVDMSDMLAELNTYSNHIDRAMGVHEEILREIDTTCHDDRTKRHWNFRKHAEHDREQDFDHRHNLDSKLLASLATTHFELLKRAHLRMRGWTKPEEEFRQLYEHLAQRLGKFGFKGSAPSTWDKSGESKGVDSLGMYVPPKEWKLDSTGVLEEGSQTKGSPKLNKALDHVWVASQQWLVS
ncbi:hypothetical protein GQ53DRAFT_870157 [Thozetella sp. PMI_491]|nr:hypothetical protein GQ53DRAFT_870157 [Thozetella sp. PMI_491]